MVKTVADKFTDKEIIKAWDEELHLANYVNENYRNGVKVSLIENTLDLINRQQAELEEARIGVKSYKSKYESAVKTAKELKTVIAEKHAEIEKLNEEKAIFDNTILYDLEQVHKISEKSKTEAIKEFAEKLKDDSWFTDLYDRNDYPVRAVTKEDIENLVKEMTNERIEQHTNSDSRQIEIDKNAQFLIKSFAEKLKNQLSFGLEDKIPANVYSFVYVTIENLLKEMVGDDK